MKMSNVANLTKLRDFFVAHPEKVSMSTWYDGVPEKLQDVDFCGTTACAAGWASIFAGWKAETVQNDDGRIYFTDDVEDKDGNIEHPAYVGREWLGLDPDVSSYLFYDVGTTQIVEALEFLIDNPNADEMQLHESLCC